MDESQLKLLAAGVVVLLLIGAIVFFLLPSPKSVPISKRLTTQKPVNLVNETQISFADPDAPVDETLTAQLIACPSTGELVADPAQCPVFSAVDADVNESATVNCDATIEEPVCGEDNNTYLNSCFATEAGLQFVEGVCVQTAAEVEEQQAEGGEEGAGETNAGGQVNETSGFPEEGQGDEGGNGETSEGGGAGGENGTAGGEGGSTESSSAGSANFTASTVEYSTTQGAFVSNNEFQLTVHRVEFDQEVGELDPVSTSSILKFAVLNLTLKNAGTSAIGDPISKMKMFESLSDTQGRMCKTRAADVMPQAFLPTSLAPGETRNGLVACELEDYANAVVFKFQSATVNVFNYVDIASQLVSSGPVGQYISSPHTGASMRVNGVSFYTTPEPGTNYKGITISGCVNDASNASDCQIAFVNVTLRNDINLPWSQTFKLDKFRLTVNDKAEKRHLTDVYDKLKQEGTELTLENMRFGEERTGLLAYSVATRVVEDRLPLVFRRTRISPTSADIDNYRGIIEVTLQ